MFDAHPDTMNDQPTINALNGPLPDTDAYNDASTAPHGRGVNNGPLPVMDAFPNGPLPDMDEPKTIHVHSGLDEDIGTLPVTDAIDKTTIDLPLGQIQDCSCDDIVEYTRKRRATPSDDPREPKKTCVRCPEFSLFSLGASPPGRNYIGAVPMSETSLTETSFGIRYRESNFFSVFDFMDEIYDSVDCALYEEDYKNPLDDRSVNDLALLFASLDISKHPFLPSSECALQTLPKDSDSSPKVSKPLKERSAKAQKTIDDNPSSDQIDDASTRDQSMPLGRQSIRFSDDFHPVDFDEDFAVRSETRKAPFECSFSTISSEPNDRDASKSAELSSILCLSSIHDASATPISSSSDDSKKSPTARSPPPTTSVSPSTTPASPSPTRSGSDSKADARPSLGNTMAVSSSSSESSSSLLNAERESTPPPAPIRRPVSHPAIPRHAPAVPNPPRRAPNAAAAARIQVQRNNLEARFCEGFMSVSLMLKDIAADHFDRTRTEALDLVNKIQRIRTSLRRLYTENDTASKTVDAIRKSYDRVKRQLTKAEAIMNRLDPIN